MKRSKKDLVIVSGAVLLALFGLWQLENYRGAKVLEASLSRLAANTGPVGYRSASEKIPDDDDNFFAAPLVFSLVDIELDSDVSLTLWDRVIYRQPARQAQLKAFDLPVEELSQISRSRAGIGVWRNHDHADDLEVWAASFEVRSKFPVVRDDASAADWILQSMTAAAGPEIQAFEAAARRPYSYAPTLQLDDHGFCSGNFSPLFHSTNRISWFFSLRMLAAIHSGEVNVYRDSFEICEKMELGILRQLNLAAFWVSNVSLNFRLNTIWVGIERGAFSEDDLRWIYQRLRALELEKFFEGSNAEDVGDERARFYAIKRRRELGHQYLGLSGSSSGVRPWVCRVCPDGWIDRNAATKIDWIKNELIDPWHWNDFSGFSTASSRLPGLDNPSSFLLFGELSGGFLQERFAELYVRKGHAELACLLEIYRLKNGDFPSELQQLVPEFLTGVPIDPFSGAPMSYVAEEGSYHIYSIGLNAIDDGGEQEHRPSRRPDLYEGDWVWRRDVEDKDQDLASGMKRALFRIRMEEETGAKIDESEFEKEWLRHLIESEADEKTVMEARQKLNVIRHYERIRKRK